jgi:predicted HTH transcriptional regulator
VTDEGEIRGVDAYLQREYGKVSEGDRNEERRLYTKALWESIRDDIQPDLKILTEWIDHAGASVLCIYVDSGERKPYSVVSTHETFIRKGATSRRAEPHEILRFAQSEDSLGRMTNPRR